MSVTPKDFDLDAWLDGADRPQRSVTVYQKAGLIAELDELASKIEHAEADEELEPSLSEVGESRRLRAKYAEAAKQFHDSALTLRIQGHYEYEKQEFKDANKDATEGELGRLILADAITSPRFTPAQVRKLEKVIGPAQFGLIFNAYHQASTAVPVVSAVFLPKSSTAGDGAEL